MRTARPNKRQAHAHAPGVADVSLHENPNRALNSLTYTRVVASQLAPACEYGQQRARAGRRGACASEHCARARARRGAKHATQPRAIPPVVYSGGVSSMTARVCRQQRAHACLRAGAHGCTRARAGARGRRAGARGRERVRACLRAGARGCTRTRARMQRTQHAPLPPGKEAEPRNVQPLGNESATWAAHSSQGGAGRRRGSAWGDGAMTLG